MTDIETGIRYVNIGNTINGIMSFFTLSNTTTLDKGSYELETDYLLEGGAEFSSIWKRVFPFLQQVIPQHLAHFDIDIPLTKEESSRFKKLLSDDLHSIVMEAPPANDHDPDKFQVCGKQVRLDLQSYEGKMIYSLDRFLKIIDDCLQHDKPVYFSLEEEFWGNSNYKGIRKLK